MTRTVNRRTLALGVITALALLVAYLLGSGLSSVATAATTYTPAASTTPTVSLASAGITVTGSGKVTGTPDTLHISLSVTASAANIDDALASANKTAKAVQDSLKAHGVKAEDMQTSGMSIQPNYTSKGEPSGYRVDENLTASLHDLSKAGVTLSAAVNAGGDNVRVDGVSVALDDTSGLVAGARTSAIDSAKTKATQYAEASGRALGEVVSISEVVQSPNPVVYGGAYAARALDQAVPIQAGTADVVVEVTVVYSFA